MAKKSGSPTLAVRTDDKPLDKKSARTRMRILDAAAQVLSDKGFAGMRLTDVAEVAQVQAPAIYYYFASREGLIEEVMWVGLADMREFLLRALQAAPDDATALDRILVAVEAHLRHELEISHYTTAAIRNSGQLPDAIAERHQAEQRKYGVIWRDLVRAANEAGELRDDLDPYVAQMLVMGTINWTVEWWKPGRVSIERVVANAQTYVRHALSPAS